MADTGWLTASTITGTGWTTPTNAAVSDSAYATVTVSGGIPSNALLLTGFGFALPSDATINGIEVEIERKVNATGLSETVVQLQSGGVGVGSNKAAIGVSWPLADAAAVYGGATDTWAASLAVADLNSSSFGVALQVTAPGANRTASVDAVRVKIHYYSVSEDDTPPFITSPDELSIVGGSHLAHTLTSSETVSWSIVGGADQAEFEISGSTLRWASDGTKSYSSGGSNEYEVVVRATDLADFTTDQTITVTVTKPFEGPTWINATSGAGSTAATSINFSSSGRQTGDKLYVAIATANQAIATPTGFTETVQSPQSRGTAAAAGGLRLGLFEKDSDGTETTVSIADSGDHQYAVGFVVRPASGQTISVDASNGKNAAAATSQSGNTLTTTAAECLIVEVWATDRDSAGPTYSAQANASLANVTERFDAGTTNGVGSGIMIVTGEKDTAGSVGATTATSAASAAYCVITLALKNTTGGGGTTGTASITEGADTAASTGALAVKGTTNATEASDTLASTSALAIAASLSATEADDTLSAQGAGLTPITGTASITEADDTVTASAALVIAGTASLTEAGDTAASTGTLALKGSLAITDADDMASGAAGLSIAGTLSATEGADMLAATATIAIQGTVSAQEAGDTLTAAGSLPIRGAVAIIEADDTLSATSGTITRGVVDIVEEMDTVSATGALAIAGTVAVNDNDDTLAATGSLSLVASAALTEADDVATITVERPYRQYPLAGTTQGYPGNAAQSYPGSANQAFPGRTDQQYPLAGRTQSYPRRAA